MEDIGAPWLRRLIVASLLAGLIVLAFEVLRPFIVPVIWAVILAYVTWPANERLRRWCRNRHGIAALVMTILMSALVIVPIIWLALLLQTEVVRAWQALVALASDGRLKVPEPLLRVPGVGTWLRDLSARIAADPGALTAEIKQLFDRSSGEIVVLVGGVGRNAAKMAIAMLTLFFMYRDGQILAAQARQVLEQFLGSRVHDYLHAIGSTVKAVVYGLVLAALAQGTLAGLGYWAAGLEAPVFLAAITTLSALIPFAVPLVWGGASLWLLATGETAAAIGLFLWGALAVSWIDNVVRPLVISTATRIPFLLVMFGVLGGIAAFGLVGLFIGPVILAVLIAVWREWLLEKAVAQAR